MRLTITRLLTRHRLSMALAVGAALCAGSVALAADSSAPAVGIWKAVVPPSAMHGEFANEDPVGLAAGKHIKTDCSMNWVSGDDGKLYCFTTGTSLLFFEEAPQAYIRAARKFYEFDRPQTR